MKIIYLSFIIMLSINSVVMAKTREEILQIFDQFSQPDVTKPVDVKESENDFIILCNNTFVDNNNQKRTINDFMIKAETMKDDADDIMSTNPALAVVTMMQASELIHRASGAIMQLQLVNARWKNCPYDSNQAWDFIEYHPELEE